MPRISGELVIENCISDLRSKLSLTQQALADLVGVTRGTIIALEKGSYNPSLELAFRLAKIFKISVDEIFFERSSNDE